MAGNKCRRFFKGVGAALLTLALTACAYTAAVLLRTPESGQGDGWQVIEEQETVGPLQAGSTGEARGFRRSRKGLRPAPAPAVHPRPRAPAPAAAPCKIPPNAVK